MEQGGEARDGQPEAAWREVLSRLDGAYSPGTIGEHVRHFGIFAAWCAARGRTALPASPDTVAEHVAEFPPRYAVRTLQIRLSTIRLLHDLAEHEDATRTRAVQLALRRWLRTHGRPPRQSRPMTAEVRDRLLEACPRTLPGLRDRLILRLGYDTLCRRTELLAMRLEEVLVLPDGSGQVVVRHGKNDPLGRGQLAFLSSATVAELEAWVARTGMTSGPILWSFRHGRLYRPLGLSSVNGLLEIMAARAGFPPQQGPRISSRSMRVGAAQDLAVSGRSLVEIMRAGRWKHLDQVALYVRNAPVNVHAGPDGDAYPAVRRRRLWRAFQRMAADRLVE